MPTTKTGYVNGSDMLLYIGSKAIGHCTSHTTTFNSETKDRSVKPVASQAGRFSDFHLKVWDSEGNLIQGSNET